MVRQVVGVMVTVAVVLTMLCCGLAAAAEEPPGGSPRVPAGRPLSLPFPRLAVWWPDTWEQSGARIARYDYVVLGPWDRENVSSLRRRNSDLIALVSTNACELSYAADGDPEETVAAATVPGEWFLTQVGSRLSAPVDATTSTLPVEAAATTSGGDGTSLRLFVPGDHVLIGQEVARVRSVDAAEGMLTVQRGYVRPASPHLAGERIAALISFWPGTWVLDLSTCCPRATADPAVGPETWGDYNARRGAALVDDPVWDGLLVDRSDGDESALIGASTARSIDPDRSNRVPADGYAAFDEAWNEGLRAYEQRLRDMVGDHRLVYANWGHPNYDLLNGNNFEGFPQRNGTAWGVPWRVVVFGPRPDGSYMDWLRRSRQPGLTTIQTYEDDRGADPTDGGDYRNPAARKGFRPDYRKMRFGLCTALLGDGFFSYEISTRGHGSLGLLWFDEYDNAGRRRGYLGRPLRTAKRAVRLPRSRVLCPGWRFDSGRDRRRWRLWADEANGCSARARIDRSVKRNGRGSLRVDIAQTNGTDWRVSLSRRVRITRRRDYTLSFWARADRAREVSAVVQQSRSPWRTRIRFGSVEVTTRWRRYVLVAPSRVSARRAMLQLQFGQSDGRVWIDDLKLQVGNSEIWRRDFESGVALVNAGTRVRTVPLRGTFRHIKGRQVRSVNSGKRVRTVRLRPRDGVILLRVKRR